VPIRSHLVAVLAATMLATAARPANADVTAFIGLTTAASANRSTSGLSVGFGVLILGFEGEYVNASEDVRDAAPSFRAGSLNVLLQTPVEFARMRFYVTAGGGMYRERLGTIQETNLAINTGGGVKIRLAGPLRLRLDYRLFKLNGDPLEGRPQRFYAGLNLAF